MRKTEKTLALLLAALLLAGLLSACGEGAVKTDVPCADIADAVAESIGGKDAMTDTGAVVIEGYMRLSPGQFGDYAVRHSAYGTGVDEFGVFKAGALSAAEAAAAAEDYLRLLRETSMIDLYTPEEKPKLTNAEVRTVGDYVMYCILSDADRATAFKTFEDMLK